MASWLLANLLGVYWGPGWESAGTFLYQGFPVGVDDNSIAPETIDDGFDWRSFEQSGTSSVKGQAGIAVQTLQNAVAKADALRHGYFMAYRMDDLVNTLAPGSMADHFFFISLDVNSHPDYTALGVVPNGTLRLSIFESEPIDFTSDSNQLVLNPSTGLATATLTTILPASMEPASPGSADPAVERYSRTWGFHTGAGGQLATPGARNVSQLWFGLQCLDGFALSADACTADVFAAPRLDDCNKYCPYTLTGPAP